MDARPCYFTLLSDGYFCGPINLEFCSGMKWRLPGWCQGCSCLKLCNMGLEEHSVKLIIPHYWGQTFLRWPQEYLRTTFLSILTNSLWIVSAAVWLWASTVRSTVRALFSSLILLVWLLSWLESLPDMPVYGTLGLFSVCSSLLSGTFCMNCSCLIPLGPSTSSLVRESARLRFSSPFQCWDLEIFPRE